MRMAEDRAATAVAPSTAFRRPPWLVPGGLLLILAVLTVNVLADGPLVGLDRRIRAVVQAQAHSAAWRWVGDGGHAPARLLVELGENQVALPVLALSALIVVVRHRSLRPLLAAPAAAASSGRGAADGHGHPGEDPYRAGRASRPSPRGTWACSPPGTPPRPGWASRWPCCCWLPTCRPGSGGLRLP